MCVIVNNYRVGGVYIYKHKSIVNGNKQKRNYLLLILF
jgi:hypothetical protein